MRKFISVLATAVALASITPTIASANDSRASLATIDLATIDFDHAFTSVAAPRRENTPPNRERLRNAGWKRILGTRS
jgi:hypothetical protein